MIRIFLILFILAVSIHHLVNDDDNTQEENKIHHHKSKYKDPKNERVVEIIDENYDRKHPKRN